MEPGVAIAILPGGDAAPADNARVEVALVEQEPAGCEPLASFRKRLVQITHHQVNRPSRGITYVAFIRVAAHVEMEAGVTVVVKRAECHVACGLKAEPHGHSLNRKGFEGLKGFFGDHKFES